MPLMAISRESAERYTWGSGCDAWRLVDDANLSVIEECMPSGTSEVRHYHQRAQQFFFILSGKAVVEAEGQLIHLSAGQGVLVLPATRHQFRNESNEPVRFLVISQPPSHGDRVAN